MSEGEKKAKILYDTSHRIKNNRKEKAKISLEKMKMMTKARRMESLKTAHQVQRF